MLVVCSRCNRHARGDACPFCGAALGGVSSSKTPLRGSRAAMFGVVALFATPFGCGARTELGGVVEEDVRDAGVEACQPSVTVYGGPFADVCLPPHDASTHDVSSFDVSSNDAEEQDVTIVPPYGAHYPDDDDGSAK